jgi:hypothetical protein
MNLAQSIASKDADADSEIDWAEEDTELPSGNLHLWEESWDDDEQNDDFSKQLKYDDNIFARHHIAANA